MQTHKKIFFLGTILLFGFSVRGADKSSISPAAQKELNEQLVNAVVYRKNVSELIKFLKAGASANTLVDEYNRPLHMAIACSAPQAEIQSLIEYNADPNLKNQYGDTPLYMALQKCDPQLKALANIQGCSYPAVVKLLLDAKSDPSIPGQYGRIMPLDIKMYPDTRDVFLNKGFLPRCTPLPLAIQHVGPRLLSFIPVKAVADMVVEYLVD